MDSCARPEPAREDDHKQGKIARQCALPRRIVHSAPPGAAAQRVVAAQPEVAEA